jgi:STE24 endopeptidase
MYVISGVAFIMIFSMLFIRWYKSLNNRFEKLRNDTERNKELTKRIEDLSAETGVSLSGVFVMKDTRTSHSNAYVEGIWFMKRVVLYDTLIQEHKPAKDNKKADSKGAK